MIILMGLAGSGKSTQGQMLAEATGREWLSVGQILRDTTDDAVHDFQRRGELVPDAVTIPLVAEVIQGLFAEGKDIVLDGYPRTIPQAEWLVENVAERVEVVVRLLVPKAELVERMKKRGRADDASIEAIHERFRLVEQNIYTVCEILSERGVKIVDVDGIGTVEEVAGRIKQAITEVRDE